MQSKDDNRNTLIAEYQRWQAGHGLSLGSADEHVDDETLSEGQRNWLRDFSRRWEANERGDQ